MSFRKKSITFLIAGVSIFALTFHTLAAEGIKVFINENPVEFDVPPQIINDRTMVPLRAIFEAMGAEVEWNEEIQTVSAVKDDIIVAAAIGNNIMYVNDEEKIMDVTPVIIDDRTLVPARFVAEAFGCDVEWDGNNNVVEIFSDDIKIIYGTIEEIQGVE